MRLKHLLAGVDIFYPTYDLGPVREIIDDKLRTMGFLWQNGNWHLGGFWICVEN